MICSRNARLFVFRTDNIATGSERSVAVSRMIHFQLIFSRTGDFSVSVAFLVCARSFDDGQSRRYGRDTVAIDLSLQESTITTQLNSGIRYFDMRVSLPPQEVRKRESLPYHHSNSSGSQTEFQRTRLLIAACTVCMANACSECSLRFARFCSDTARCVATVPLPYPSLTTGSRHRRPQSSLRLCWRRVRSAPWSE